MNKIVIIIVIVLVIVIGSYFVYTYQSPAYKTTDNAPNTNTPVITNSQPTTENLSASVSIKNFAFNPTSLTIKMGTTVTWTNNDSMAHQIKSTTFNSEALSKGQSFQFTFSAVGEYNYSCAIHPSMLGKIIVTQ